MIQKFLYKTLLRRNNRKPYDVKTIDAVDVGSTSQADIPAVLDELSYMELLSSFGHVLKINFRRAQLEQKFEAVHASHLVVDPLCKAMGALQKQNGLVFFCGFILLSSSTSRVSVVATGSFVLHQTLPTPLLIAQTTGLAVDR